MGPRLVMSGFPLYYGHDVGERSEGKVGIDQKMEEV